MARITHMAHVIRMARTWLVWLAGSQILWTQVHRYHQWKISDGSPQLSEVPKLILVATFHGGLGIFQLQALLDLSCTRCWWSDMFLTEQEFFRYQIPRKNHFRPENSITATQDYCLVPTAPRSFSSWENRRATWRATVSDLYRERSKRFRVLAKRQWVMAWKKSIHGKSRGARLRGSGGWGRGGGATEESSLHDNKRMMYSTRHNGYHVGFWIRQRLKYLNVISYRRWGRHDFSAIV